MAGGYNIQLSKILNRDDLKTKYASDPDYAAGILYVEVPSTQVSKIMTKKVIVSERAVSKNYRDDITGETSTGLLYRTISGNKRYSIYLYDYGKVSHVFRLTGTVKKASRALVEAEMQKFDDLAEDGGTMTFTWHNKTFSVNITSSTFTETTKKMSYVLDFEITLVLGFER